MAIETLQKVIPLTQRPFTVAEYDRMIAVGILTEDERIELIEGVFVEMSPIGHRHAACIKRIIALFGSRVGPSVMLDIQNPIHLSDYSEPQPDAVLLQPSVDAYEHANPTAADVLLLIEVADSSLEYDRTVKTALYARGLIGEVWVVDLASETIAVFTDPADGRYQSVRTAKKGESLTPTALPDLTLRVDQLFN